MDKIEREYEFFISDAKKKLEKCLQLTEEAKGFYLQMLDNPKRLCRDRHQDLLNFFFEVPLLFFGYVVKLEREIRELELEYNQRKARAEEVQNE